MTVVHGPEAVGPPEEASTTCFLVSVDQPGPQYTDFPGASEPRTRFSGAPGSQIQPLESMSHVPGMVLQALPSETHPHFTQEKTGLARCHLPEPTLRSSQVQGLCFPLYLCPPHNPLPSRQWPPLAHGPALNHISSLTNYLSASVLAASPSSPER